MFGVNCVAIFYCYIVGRRFFGFGDCFGICFGVDLGLIFWWGIFLDWWEFWGDLVYLILGAFLWFFWWILL